MTVIERKYRFYVYVWEGEVGGVFIYVKNYAWCWLESHCPALPGGLVAAGRLDQIILLVWPTGGCNKKLSPFYSRCDNFDFYAPLAWEGKSNACIKINLSH